MDRNRHILGVCERKPASLSARRAWIEMQVPVSGGYLHGSLSARRAWIEIGSSENGVALALVALRKESVDRNMTFPLPKKDAMPVALRKESVDRNPYLPLAKVRHCESLSARRAWIEIGPLNAACIWVSVALRKESVDRNIKGNPYLQIGRQSLSARRAWIEIIHPLRGTGPAIRRSPQGERG